MSRQYLPIAALLLAFAGIAHAQDCALVSLSSVDDALPSRSRWQAWEVSPGECQFVGASSSEADRSAAGLLNVSLRLMASTKDAEVHQRAQLAEAKGNCTDANGDSGLDPPLYACRSKVTPDGRQLLFVTTHRGRTVARVTLTAPAGSIPPADVRGAARLAEQSLSFADDDSRLLALWHCPWLHGDAIKKLLGRAGYGQQTGAYETCIARSSVGTLGVVTAEADLAPEIAPTVGGECKLKPLPELGEYGSITGDCENLGGEPLASVQAIVGDKFIQYIFQPGRQPTAAERGLLIQIAKDAQAASR